jgi:hypothetical protein
MEFLWEEIKKLLEMLTTEHSRWQTSEEDRRQELACATARRGHARLWRVKNTESKWDHFFSIFRSQILDTIEDDLLFSSRYLCRNRQN